MAYFAFMNRLEYPENGTRYMECGIWSAEYGERNADVGFREGELESKNI